MRIDLASSCLTVRNCPCEKRYAVDLSHQSRTQPSVARAVLSCPQSGTQSIDGSMHLSRVILLYSYCIHGYNRNADFLSSASFTSTVHYVLSTI
jgi:hypothetical protein